MKYSGIRRLSGVIRLAQCNHLVHKRAKRGRTIRGKCVMMEALGPDDTINGFDDGGRTLNQQVCK